VSPSLETYLNLRGRGRHQIRACADPRASAPVSYTGPYSPHRPRHPPSSDVPPPASPSPPSHPFTLPLSPPFHYPLNANTCSEQETTARRTNAEIRGAYLGVVRFGPYWDTRDRASEHPRSRSRFENPLRTARNIEPTLIPNSKTQTVFEFGMVTPTLEPCPQP